MPDRRLTLLLTGGRAPATLELCRLFHAEGHRVLVAETTEHHLCRYSRAVAKSFTVPAPTQDSQGYVEALAAIARTEAVDCVIPACEETFYLAMHKESFPVGCKVFVDSIDTLKVLHNKWEFNRLLQELGISAPRTWLFRSLEDLRKNIPRDVKIIIKPVYSRFASKIQLLEAGDRDPQKELCFDCPWVAQEFVEGQHFRSYSVVQKGQITAHAIYPARFCTGKMGACLAYEAVDMPKIFRWVQHFAESISYNGQLAFDLIVDSDGNILPIECNPRAIGGVHLFTDGQGLSRAFLGSEQPLIEPKVGTRKQALLGMLLLGSKAALSEGNLLAFFKTLILARDVVFRWTDLKPWLYQPLLLKALWKHSRALGVDIIAASTSDIEWNG